MKLIGKTSQQIATFLNITLEEVNAVYSKLPPPKGEQLYERK
jgi:hypothetical protein